LPKKDVIPMEIQVSKLREVLDLLKLAVPRKTTLPVTMNAWLGDGKIVATDLDTAVRVNLPDIAGASPMLLPFKDALEFLKRAPGHRMAVLTAEGKSVRMSVDGAQATFQVEDVADYPVLSPVEGEGQGVLDGDALVRAMLAVAPYAATEDTRPTLRAVCLTQGETLEAASADGFRLAWETIPGKLATQKPMLVSTGTVEILAHLWKKCAQPDMANVSDLAGLARAKRLVRLTWTDGKLQISFGEIAIIAQLIQGAFPNYRQLIPSNTTATATVTAEDMERALRQLALAARDGSGIVRMTWEGDKLLLSAKSEKFESSVPVPATCSGPGRTAVSIKYLMEYCKGRIGKITLSCSTSSGPVLFSHRDHPHVVMMPMFVKWEDEQGQQAAEETRAEPSGVPTAEAEGTEVVVEGEDAVDIGTAAGEVEATAEKNSNPPPKKSKRPRRKAEAPED